MHRRTDWVTEWVSEWLTQLAEQPASRTTSVSQSLVQSTCKPRPLTHSRISYRSILVPSLLFLAWISRNFRSFYRATAMLSAVYAVVVCPSVCVCVSVTLRYCIKTAKRRITQITLHNSPLTLVFWHQSSLRNSKGITPYGGEKCRWGGLKFVTFDEKRAITRKRYKIDVYSFY